MKQTYAPVRLWLRHTATLALTGMLAVAAIGQSGIKINGSGEMNFVEGGTSTFFLEGTASHLGVFRCDGEINYVPGAKEGSLDGTGVAVFRAANGDQLVATVTDTISEQEDGDIHFKWSDSVQFSDGSVAYSTGRFEDKRPPGLVVKYKVICILDICFILIQR